MAQLTIANSNTQHYVKMLSTATTKPPSTSKFYVDFEKNFFQRSKNWNTPFYLQMFCALSGRSLSWNTPVFSRFTSREHANFIGCHFFFTLMCFLRKALDNIDLNQMSHRYVSGALQNDWDVPLDFRSLDRSQRGCCIWVYIVWVIKWSIWSFPVYITQKNLKSVIDSAVLHWTTRLMVFPRNVGFSVYTSRNPI